MKYALNGMLVVSSAPSSEGGTRGFLLGGKEPFRMRVCRLREGCMRWKRPCGDVHVTLRSSRMRISESEVDRSARKVSLLPVCVSTKFTFTSRTLCSEVFRRSSSVRASADIDGRFERLRDVRRLRLSLLGGTRLLRLKRQLRPLSERCVSVFGRFANKLGGRYTLGSDNWEYWL